MPTFVKRFKLDFEKQDENTVNYDIEQFEKDVKAKNLIVSSATTVTVTADYVLFSAEVSESEPLVLSGDIE